MTESDGVRWSMGADGYEYDGYGDEYDAFGDEGYWNDYDMYNGVNTAGRGARVEWDQTEPHQGGRAPVHRETPIGGPSAHHQKDPRLTRYEDYHYEYGSNLESTGFFANRMERSPVNDSILLLQIVSTVMLFAIFMFNYHLNGDFRSELGSFVGFVGTVSLPFAAFVGFGTGMFMFYLSSMKEGLKRWIIWMSLSLFVMLFFGGPLMVYMLGGSDEMIYGSFYRSLVGLLKAMTILIFLAPMVFGTYGIWKKRSLFVGLSGMFIISTVVIISSYDMILTGEIPTLGYDRLAELVVFAVAFFCFIEIADSVSNISRMVARQPEYESSEFFQQQLEAIIQRYIRFFFLFVILSTVIVLLSLDLTGAITKWAPQSIARSVELQSIFGMVVSIVIMVVVLVIVGTLIRMKDQLMDLMRWGQDQIWRFMHPRPKPRPLTAGVGDGAKPLGIGGIGRIGDRGGNAALDKYPSQKSKGTPVARISPKRIKRVKGDR